LEAVPTGSLHIYIYTHLRSPTVRDPALIDPAKSNTGCNVADEALSMAGIAPIKKKN